LQQKISFWSLSWLPFEKVCRNFTHRTFRPSATQQVFLLRDDNSGHYTWRTMCLFGCISAPIGGIILYTPQIVQEYATNGICLLTKRPATLHYMSEDISTYFHSSRPIWRPHLAFKHPCTKDIVTMFEQVYTGSCRRQRA
jgi:hypothetical protein